MTRSAIFDTPGLMKGIINLNKPAGMTSHGAVSKVKRLLGARKAGHTGTLDPLATGVLLVCLNEATKISRFLLDMDKKYRAKVRLGVRTDTGDAEGRIVEEKDLSGVTREKIVETVATFSGKMKQKPPMYSAVKIGGEKLYVLARKGIEVERTERVVEIYDIGVVDIALPFFEIEVSCSKGTYVRTLCEDIGYSLGTVAHLAALERTGIGPFDLKDSLTFEGLEKEMSRPGAGFFCSIDTALCRLEEMVLDEKDYERARHGMQIIVNDINKFADNSVVRLKDPEGNLFGIGRIDSHIARIERLLNLSQNPAKC